jgi:peroxiredoxin
MDWNAGVRPAGSPGAYVLAAKPLVNAIDVAIERARNLDASVNDRLQMIFDEVKMLNPRFAAGVERLIARLTETGAGSGAPKVGDRMPPFLLPDESGNLVGLNDLLQRGPAIIAFNRGHWCPYCRVNTAALAEVHRQAKASGADIVAIMPDRQKFTRLLKSDARAPFPILTDMDNGYAMSLNLVMWIGSEMQGMMPAAGVDLPQVQGNEGHMLPIPATFVTGTDGRITARHVDPDYRKRMELDDLLKAIREAR